MSVEQDIALESFAELIKHMQYLENLFEFIKLLTNLLI